MACYGGNKTVCRAKSVSSLSSPSENTALQTGQSADKCVGECRVVYVCLLCDSAEHLRGYLFQMGSQILGQTLANTTPYRKPTGVGTGFKLVEGDSLKSSTSCPKGPTSEAAKLCNVLRMLISHHTSAAPLSF